MRHVDIKTKIPELLPNPPAWAEFVRLGDLLKLRHEADGTFHHANYESGLLLYALVRHFRPQNILEIGTGRGYGAFCMAWAQEDAGLTGGKIITLDVKGYDEPQTWALDEGHGPNIAQRSLRQVWEAHLPPSWRARVEHRQGFSDVSLRRLLDENNFHPDFVYIDGDHTFTVTRQDLYASFLLVGRPFRILMDDYTPHSHLYGVRRLVDAQLAPIFELEAIYNDRRWYGEPYEHEPLETFDYAQILLDSEKTKVDFEAAFPPARLQATLKASYRWGKSHYRLELALNKVRRWLGQG